MNDVYIQSITLSIPATMVYGDAKQLNRYFKDKQWGTYLKYGDTSLLLIDTRGFNRACSLGIQTVSFLSMLQSYGIVSPGLGPHYQANIHEIKLRFDIDIPGVIFCRTEKFLKIKGDMYRSDDTHKYLRKSGYDDKKESKGRQMSFVTVIQREAGSSVILSFSGKYRAHISPDLLYHDNDELIQCLCSFGSIYLTQATDPKVFEIARGYIPFLPEIFYSMLKDANWFDGSFRRKNITPNFLGGVLL